MEQILASLKQSKWLIQIILLTLIIW
jgi:hypothetical protein